MRQHLCIDADDTLWENNIYFEQAIHRFLTFLDHSSLPHHEIQAMLNKTEREMGYGSRNFTKSLLETYRQLSERPISAEDLAQVSGFGEAIFHHPIELIAGVEETLTYLAPRHQLILLTKGDEEEQMLKITNSGLASHFEHLLVVLEKDQDTYHQLLQDFQLNPEQTWMIGNSPRSDINPALAAGLNAVFIPHQHTWQQELQDVTYTGKGQLLQLTSFALLREHF